MKKELTIKITEESRDYIQRAYMEYRSKQDIIASVFDIHKYDTDAAILESVPFKHYEKEFEKAKLVYDTALSESEKNYIEEEIRNKGAFFVVDFDECVLKVTYNE